jgi:hypothetical protein
MIMGLGASRFWWPQGLIECLQERRFRRASLICGIPGIHARGAGVHRKSLPNDAASSTGGVQR